MPRHIQRSRAATHLFLICAIALLSTFAQSSIAASQTDLKDFGRSPPANSAAPANRFSEIFDDGLKAYDAGRYARAYNLWLSIANQGDLAAMGNLAHLLRKGLGVEANAEEAAKWYAIAAKRGLTSAQVNLAELFYNGNGVPQNYKLAAQWYARAARAGHAHAQYKLATMIEDGHTSPGNVELAKKLHGWAIDAGHSSALEHYRQLDARKRPVTLQSSRIRDEADLKLETSTTLKTLAGSGDIPSADSLYPEESDESDLTKARREFVHGERSNAVAIWRRLALNSNYEAQYRLALALMQGHGVRKDLNKATHWLDIAATGGHQDAEELLKTLSVRTP